MSCRGKDVVLITGGSGLVGSSIKYLVEVGDEGAEEFEFVLVSSRDANLLDADETRLIFEKYRPSYVIHLAAKVGGLYANMRDNDIFYHSNTKINENVLKASFEFKVKKCISCLSTCIFPDRVELPLDESKIHLGPPHKSNRGYSMAKREVDLLNRTLNQESLGRSLFTAVIPTNLYGKHDNFDLENAHVIPGLIHKAYLSVIDAKNSGLDEAILVVCGTGNPLRQFVYAPDLARILIWCIRAYDNEDPMIVCPDKTEEHSILDVARMICDIYSRKFTIKIQLKFDTSFADGQSSKTATNRKLRGLLPDFEFTAIQHGLKHVIDWFCEAFPNARKGGR